jgi:hypothetical protein
MPKLLANKPDRNFSGGRSMLQSQKPLPPYELDPRLDNPVMCKRIGELIATAAKKQLSKQ